MPAYFSEVLAASTKMSYVSTPSLVLHPGEFPPSQSPKHCLTDVSFLAQEGLADTSIKAYLSAICQLQIEQSLPDPFQTPMPRLEQVIKGIKVRQKIVADHEENYT